METYLLVIFWSEFRFKKCSSLYIVLNNIICDLVWIIIAIYVFVLLYLFYIFRFLMCYCSRCYRTGYLYFGSLSCEIFFLISIRFDTKNFSDNQTISKLPLNKWSMSYKGKSLFWSNGNLSGTIIKFYPHKTTKMNIYFSYKTFTIRFANSCKKRNCFRNGGTSWTMYEFTGNHFQLSPLEIGLNRGPVATPPFICLLTSRSVI